MGGCKSAAREPPLKYDAIVTRMACSSSAHSRSADYFGPWIASCCAEEAIRCLYWEGLQGMSPAQLKPHMRAASAVVIVAAIDRNDSNADPFGGQHFYWAQSNDLPLLIFYDADLYGKADVWFWKQKWA